MAKEVKQNTTTNDKALLTYARLREFYKINESKFETVIERKIKILKKELRNVAVPKNNNAPELKGFKIGIAIALAQALEIKNFNPIYMKYAFSSNLPFSKISLWHSFQKINDSIPTLFQFDDYAKKITSAILSKNKEKIEDEVESFCVDISKVDATLSGKKYKATFTSGSIFITLDNKYAKESGKNYGWKFHIAVKNTNDNLEKGWNIIKDILIENNITSFKVNASEEKLTSSQTGKQITLYAFDNPNMKLADWKALFKSLEGKLKSSEIVPAKHNPGDKTITGSTYISYRNDEDDQGKYISAKDAMAVAKEKHETNPSEWYYNPYGREDPYAGLDLSSQEQHQYTP